MQTYLCVVLKHRITKIVRSGWLMAAKGMDRNIAVFDGELFICECGKEIYKGRSHPWFEGTVQQFCEQFPEQMLLLKSA